MEVPDASAAEYNRHPVFMLLSAFFWMICTFVHLFLAKHFPERRPVYLLSWAKALVAFATITLPTWIYAALSYSMTLTVRNPLPVSPLQF